MIHLDTNLLIALLDPSHIHAAVVEKLVRRGTPLACSSLAWMELNSQPIPRTTLQLLRDVLVGRIIPFSEKEAIRSGEWFQKSGAQRKLRFDCAIAAAAFESQASLATMNRDDFKIFTPWGLKLEKNL